MYPQIYDKVHIEVFTETDKGEHIFKEVYNKAFPQTEKEHKWLKFIYEFS
jgi:hypothetical protein